LACTFGWRFGRFGEKVKALAHDRDAIACCALASLAGIFALVCTHEKERQAQKKLANSTPSVRRIKWAVEQEEAKRLPTQQSALSQLSWLTVSSCRRELVYGESLLWLSSSVAFQPNGDQQQSRTTVNNKLHWAQIVGCIFSPAAPFCLRQTFGHFSISLD